jgi:hypothetical protein
LEGRSQDKLTRLLSELMAKFSVFIEIWATWGYAFVKTHYVSRFVHFIADNLISEGKCCKYWAKDHDINAEIFMGVYTDIAFDFEIHQKWEILG